jgi:hypothetical protein
VRRRVRPLVLIQVMALVLVLVLFAGPGAVDAGADPFTTRSRSGPPAADPAADRGSFRDGPQALGPDRADLAAQAPTGSTIPVAPGAGDPGTSGNTPQPVGRPYPPTSQRVADSLIAVWVLVMLGGGIALGWYLSWRSGRRPGRDSPASPVAAGDPGADPAPPSR